MKTIKNQLPFGILKDLKRPARSALNLADRSGADPLGPLGCRC
jgi:hypothetical protein